jgi:hypothetical protein
MAIGRGINIRHRPIESPLVEFLLACGLRSPRVRLMARTGKFGKTRHVLNKYDEDQ